MYFAKFLHKPPGDDDRLVLLALGSDTLMGIYLKEVDYLAFDWSKPLPPGANLPGEFLRQAFDTASQSIAAFRHEVERLRAAGYVETHHTDYTLRDLGGDFTPKPAWQRLLDDAMMASFADPVDVQANRLAALAETPAADEPMALWLAARHAGAIKSSDALERAERARDTLVQREAGKQPYYTWSLPARAVKGHVYALLARRHLDARATPDASAALGAIDAALDAYRDEDRLILQAWILSTHFPEREEDAYDSIYRYADRGGYESITARASWAAYAARRAADTAAGRATWRWSGGHQPADAAAIAAAEAALDVRFPDAYRAFLQERGRCDLFVRLPDEDTRLRFAGPDQLSQMREDFIHFVTLTDSEANAAASFRESSGVALRHLVPIAEPYDASNLVLLHTEPGDRYGRCFVWNHDGAWELVHEQPDFPAMLAMVLDGIERQEAAALDLFNVPVDPPHPEEAA
ncbi:SMI1/KNR4 family protein [Reyranella sp. CPCC 100927]|uniref:SMI1/KNR4 family protein n=1 Tax=Reyranella sp. CPCC 100927 TaxID=2599616 RepID=UPI0011B4CB53|nr:SMI1/KNR4 family protein [Reyranella sp. CPCC 100927]TWS99887.1 SMI1/KNR4 family protein [Reyranella sp. CPCC 100927]